MMKKLRTMRSALEDPEFLGADDMLGGESWAAWRVVLIACMGEPLTDAEREVYRTLTGRATEPTEQVEELWAIIGRRGGKTRAIAALATYLSACIDYRGVLAIGQFGLLPVIAASKEQATECFNYIEGMFATAPYLAGLLMSAPTASTLTLRSRVEIQVRAGSWRRSRGFTAIAVIGDEVAFWASEASSANPDEEILRAVRPALGTTHGPLIMISSPYAKRGTLYETFRRHYGEQGHERIVVIKAASKVMNPILSDRVVARAYEEDPTAAASEYGAEWRSDVDSFIGDEVVRPLILQGVFEIAPKAGTRCVGFVDAASGSGGDAMTMGIAFKDGKEAVLAHLGERRPPFDPASTTEEFAGVLKRYGITKVTGDKWAAGFVEAAFKQHGIAYEASAAPKSDLYKEFAPLLNSGAVRLLDNKRMLIQLLGLERRTARGGRDTIDHAPNSHDDLINAACGALVTLSRARAPMVISKELLARAATPGAFGPRAGRLDSFYPVGTPAPGNLLQRRFRL